MLKEKIENLKQQHPKDAAKVLAATVEALEAVEESLRVIALEGFDVVDLFPADAEHLEHPDEIPGNHPEQ